MKKSLLALLITASATLPAHATIEFWHSNVQSTDDGICAAHFTFDSGGKEIGDLKVSFSAVDKSGAEVIADSLDIEAFGQGDIDRYADAEVESGDMCQEDLTIIVSAATATIDGKEVDLLATKQLVARDFKPFKIGIGSNPLRPASLKRSHAKKKGHVA